MKFNIKSYAEAEVELARFKVGRNPDDQQQKDRLAYWLAELGNIEEALTYASEDMKNRINGK